VYGFTLTIINSTVSANKATGSGVAAEGGYAQGGGLSVTTSLTLTSVTVAENSVTGIYTGTGTGPASASGGGVWTPTASVSNSIVALNQRTGTTGAGADVAGAIASQGYNLIGTADGSTGWVATDQKGTDASRLNPGLGPLQDNGGDTYTYALLPGSHALNAGDPALAGTTDQRGVVRGSLVNIGAYQATATAIVVQAPDTVTAGEPFDVVILLVDDFGQVAIGYTGTIHLTSTDPSAPDLGSYDLSPSDAGQVTFSGVIQYTTGTQTLTADDGSLSGSLDVMVT